MERLISLGNKGLPINGGEGGIVDGRESKVVHDLCFQRLATQSEIIIGIYGEGKVKAPDTPSFMSSGSGSGM